jgi:hypothetical protein
MLACGFLLDSGVDLPSVNRWGTVDRCLGIAAGGLLWRSLLHRCFQTFNSRHAVNDDAVPENDFRMYVGAKERRAKDDRGDIVASVAGSCNPNRVVFFSSPAVIANCQMHLRSGLARAFLD